MGFFNSAQYVLNSISLLLKKNVKQWVFLNYKCPANFKYILG